MFGLEPADDAVADANLRPVLAGVVEREDPAHLGLEQPGIRVSEELGMDQPARVLRDDRRRVMLEVVGDERERHRVAVGPGPSGVRTKAETRRCRKGERAIWRDGQVPRRRVSHGPSRLWTVDDHVDHHGQHDAHDHAEQHREEE